MPPKKKAEAVAAVDYLTLCEYEVQKSDRTDLSPDLIQPNRIKKFQSFMAHLKVTDDAHLIRLLKFAFTYNDWNVIIAIICFRTSLWPSLENFPLFDLMQLGTFFTRIKTCLTYLSLREHTQLLNQINTCILKKFAAIDTLQIIKLLSSSQENSIFYYLYNDEIAAAWLQLLKDNPTIPIDQSLRNKIWHIG